MLAPPRTAERIRVLVVDDAVVVRRMVSDALASDPELEVAGTAHNGRLALERIPQLRPDVVTLDVEMPELDGLETLRALRKTYPRLPVIMFSTLTERGAAATLDALALGANDYVTKPSNVGSVALAQQRIRDELVPKIKAWCRGAVPAAGKPVVARVSTVPSIAVRAARIEIVAVGVSTGGPNALAELLAALPASFPVPVVIVQHMPPVFTRLLAERLDARSPLSVREAAGGEELAAGQVWLAPGDYHLEVVRRVGKLCTRLHQQPPENSCRPAVDVLFRSAAAAQGAGALAVVMTGMGQDGLRGCEAIRQAGGRVFAQDEATSVVWGMPGAVVRAGLAEQVLPLCELAPALMRAVSRGQKEHV